MTGKTFKKTLAIIITFLMFLSTIPTNTISAETNADHLEYSINNNEVTITGYWTFLGNELIIPEEIEGYPVTAIADNAFIGISVTSITIPQSINSIGHMAFVYSNVSEIKVDILNPNYTTVDGVLFSKDMSLLIQYPVRKDITEYTIPDTVICIDDFAFADSTNLTSVTIPEGVTDINFCAFSNCTNLTSVTTPKSISQIGVNAFEYCSDDFALHGYSGSVAESYANANDINFISLDQPTTEDIPDGLQYSINDDEVSITGYTGNATKLTIPQKIEGCDVKYISEEAFAGCTSLEQVIIPYGVTIISRYAFNSCYNLKNIFIPNSIKGIQTWIFEDCYKLTDIYYGGSKEEWETLNYRGNEFVNDVIIHYETSEIPITEPTEAPVIIETIPTESAISTTSQPESTTSIEPTETTLPETSVAITTITVPTTASTTITVEIFIVGDVNIDEKINIKDATLIQKYLAKVTGLSEIAILLADCDSNEKVNIKDATSIQKHIAGFEIISNIGTPIALNTETEPTNTTQEENQITTIQTENTELPTDPNEGTVSLLEHNIVSEEYYVSGTQGVDSYGREYERYFTIGNGNTSKSYVIVNVEKKYQTFTTSVSATQNFKTNKTSIVNIYLDDVLTESFEITKSTYPKQLSIDISDTILLKIEVTNDIWWGYDGAQVMFGNPIFTNHPEYGEPTQPAIITDSTESITETAIITTIPTEGTEPSEFQGTEATDETIYLVDHNIVSQEYYVSGTDGLDAYGREYGKYFTIGNGNTSKSYVIVNVEKKYATFTTSVSATQNFKTNKTSIVNIYLDDILTESFEITKSTYPKQLSIDISDTILLKIEVTNDIWWGYDGAQVMFGNPIFTNNAEQIETTLPDNITEPTEDTTTPVSYRTVYFSNVNDWETVYAYCRNDTYDMNAVWPGMIMTLVKENNGFGQQLYSYDVPTNCNYIVFNDGGGNQCVEINLDNEAYNGFYLNGEIVNDKGHYGYHSYMYTETY